VGELCRPVRRREEEIIAARQGRCLQRSVGEVDQDGEIGEGAGDLGVIYDDGQAVSLAGIIPRDRGGKGDIGRLSCP
jgi:hypothetical protein